MSEKRVDKFFSIVIAAVILIEGIFISLNPIRAIAADNYRLWRQWDSRWGSIYLGSSTDTMARSGCLVTAIAILAVHSGTKDPETFNPGTLVTSLNNVGAFDSGGAIASWAKVTEVIPEIKFVKSGSFSSSTQSGKAAEILAVINQGYYVICNVGGHWVFIEGVSGSDVYMIDSAKDDIKMFSAYSNSNITSWQAYTGKNPPNNIIGPLQSSTTTTTTTTTSTTTTTTTTTTAPVYYEKGEYYYLGNGYVCAYSSSTGNSVADYVWKGSVVNITLTENGRGRFNLNDGFGWIDMRQLVYAGSCETHQKGDINNDGQISISDLALLNEYLKSRSELPNGISILRECEIKAADINGDGTVDNLDVQEYLAIICS